MRYPVAPLVLVAGPAAASDARRRFAVEHQERNHQAEDCIIWIDVEPGDRTVDDILPRAQ